MQYKRRYEIWRSRHARLCRVLVALVVLAGLGWLAFWALSGISVVTVQAAGGRVCTLLTASTQPAQWLAEAGAYAAPHDQLILSQTEDGTLLQVQRAFSASVRADGETYTEYFTGGTVADLLDAGGIVLGPDDTVTPAADTPLAEGLAAAVHRVEYVKELRRENLDEAVVTAYINGLPAPGEFVPSTNAHEYDVLYRDKLLDGVVVESEVLELVPLYEAPTPRPADSYSLESGVPASRIEEYDDIEFGPDGLPLGATSVMRGAVTTAYSASRGRGASGLGLYCGTVAVNPNVIPYGTRMWITDANQNFVYGFAIATDTGTAMMEGVVDIDLFFETNAECLQFGKRAMDVYIFGPEGLQD